jgi:hypothetical protein
MKQESVVELQGRIFERIFGFVELPSVAAAADAAPLFVDPAAMEPRAFGVRAARRTRARALEDIALGTAAGTAGDDRRLAVLVQNRQLMSSAPVDQIRAMAHDEVDLVYIGRQQPLWTRQRNQPLRLGCSIAPIAMHVSGTLGCFCRDNSSGKEGFISNNHILANCNRVPVGTAILQMSGPDGGQASQDVVGLLERYVPLQFGGIPNDVDAAFATSNGHGRGEDRHTVFDNSWPPQPVVTVQPSVKAQAFPGVDVLKTGRTTGHTLGTVRAINVNNLLIHMGAGTGVARFDGQTTFEARSVQAGPFSRPGDSGALIVDDQGRPMALLFAGSQSGGTGNFGIVTGSPIMTVETQLNVSLA